MVEQDPHETIDPPYVYECTNCGERVEADSRPGECPNCGGAMENISKPRE